jgi:hypothetical protein
VPRGDIYGLSKEAARRFRELLVRIDYAKLAVNFITLTYPQSWSDQPADWYEDIHRYADQLADLLGDNFIALVWRKEFQRRGAPHFHCLLLTKRPVELELLRTFTRETWTRRTEWGLLKGTWVRTEVQRARMENQDGARKLMQYISGYLAKRDQAHRMDRETGERLPTGRMWGHFGELPLDEGEPFVLSGAALVAFLKRYREAHPRSTYAQRVSDNWGSYLLYGPAETFRQLLYGCSEPYP